MRRYWQRLGILGGLILVGSLGWAADLAGDIARIHVEAIGGADRLQRLESFRASGVVRAGQQEMKVQMWSARPNRIRIELESGGRLLRQGWNGEAAPWVQNGADAKVQEMPPRLADDFKAESDFDDVLYRATERGYVLGYAGEDKLGDRAVIKLTAKREGSREENLLYLAADTYFILRQDRTRLNLEGKSVTTQTYYADFRPVLGVLLPHRVTVWDGEQLRNEVILDWMEPNPPVASELFTRP